jgi:4-alpha-glucanotransferase
MFLLQDWLAMDASLRGKNLHEERINLPEDPFNQWRYRMHLNVEELMEAKQFNAKVRTMISRSQR